uniref:CDP-alcohol phosphatidyltransferase family protein n=1 Tax=Thaumasiovibrio occultus TaxID=1891184 RepID=UPI000D3A1332|nr:CDP-alcohol phosphatidyltransferase family protein [Thaumasiovibrio occultus]
MEHSSQRRPLAVRRLSLIKRIASTLADKNITPNQVSLLSMGFALLGGVFALGYHVWPSAAWLLLFALAIQGRLLCNLFDGMIAVEGGKQTPGGELFNDLPDRISDPLFIVAASLFTASALGIALAVIVSFLAIMTAYIRVLGTSMGCAADFRGPMAKQHRMALLTVTAVIMSIDRAFALLPTFGVYLMDFALVLMLLGSLVTCWRRLRAIYLSCAAASHPALNRDKDPPQSIKATQQTINDTQQTAHGTQQLNDNTAEVSNG